MSPSSDRPLGFPGELTQEEIDASVEDHMRRFPELYEPSSEDGLPRTLEEDKAMDLREFLENFSEWDVEWARTDSGVVLMKVTVSAAAGGDGTFDIAEDEFARLLPLNDYARYCAMIEWMMLSDPELDEVLAEE